MGRVKEIIKELKNNDYRSFDEFYSMTSKLVYYIIAGIIRNKDTVEDLMQDTYLKFIQNIPKIIQRFQNLRLRLFINFSLLR